MGKKIRIGLLIDDFSAPAWVYEMVGEIANSHYAEICLIVKRANTSAPKKFFQKWKAIYNHLLYLLFVKFERKYIRNEPDAFAPKDLQEHLKNIPVMEVVVTGKKHSDYFSPEDVTAIKKFEIDVFIRLGFRILKGDILTAAKYGIWSYHHGDNFINRGGPAGVWEIFEKSSTTGSVLQILTEDLDNGKILYRSWSATDPSIIRNLNNYYWKSLSFLPRKLKQLYEIGGPAFLEKIETENNKLAFYSNRLYKTPTNFRFLVLLISHVMKWLRLRIWNLFNFEQWILLYHFSKEPSISTSIYKYKSLIPPKDRFWADPFVMFKNSRYYIFIEEYIYKNKRGHISLIEMDEEGNMTSPVPVLERSYHLSYPFIFEHNTELYMIPETFDNKTIELYKSKNFPCQWEFDRVIMNNIEAVDSTIYFHNNKYWLFTNIKERKGASVMDELYIFYTDDPLTGNWLPHTCNPVISDVRKARSAGRLFIFNGLLYRPSQDCSVKYGYRVIFNEVVVLNENEYKERISSSISPDWNSKVIGTHTFSYDKNLTFIDALIKRKK